MANTATVSKKRTRIGTDVNCMGFSATFVKVVTTNGFNFKSTTANNKYRKPKYNA